MIEKLVKSNYDKLNKTELSFLFYLSLNKNICKDKSLDQLAQMAKVDKREAKSGLEKIGIADGRELQRLLRVGQFNADQLDINKLVFDMEDTINLSKNFYDEDLFEDIRRADRVFAYGTGNIQKSVCRELKRIFIFMNRPLFLIEGQDELDTVANILGDRDLLIIVSLSGENKLALDLIDQARERGTKVFSISKKGYNSMVKKSDYYMQYFSNILFVDDKGVDIAPLTHMFLLVDFIFINYYKYIESLGYR